MDGVIIFVNIDPMFNIALHVLKELNEQGRLTVTNVQRSWLESIQSNDGNNDNRLRFGGQNAPNAGQSASAFGNTASAVFRKVMLSAVQIQRDFWPKLSKISEQRNMLSLTFEVLPLPNNEANEPFKLLDNADNRDTARSYWSKYDQAFPHFLIESKVLANNANGRVDFNNMMLIFRNNFSEVIEITTNANATMNPPNTELGTFRSYVHVLCIRRKITSDNEDKQGGYFEALKKSTESVTINENYKDDILEMFQQDEDKDDDWLKELNELKLCISE